MDWIDPHAESDLYARIFHLGWAMEAWMLRGANPLKKVWRKAPQDAALAVSLTQPLTRLDPAELVERYFYDELLHEQAFDLLAKERLEKAALEILGTTLALRPDTVWEIAGLLNCFRRLLPHPHPLNGCREWLNAEEMSMPGACLRWKEGGPQYGRLIWKEMREASPVFAFEQSSGALSACGFPIMSRRDTDLHLAALQGSWRDNSELTPWGQIKIAVIPKALRLEAALLVLKAGMLDPNSPDYKVMNFLVAEAGADYEEQVSRLEGWLNEMAIFRAIGQFHAQQVSKRTLRECGEEFPSPLSFLLAESHAMKHLLVSSDQNLYHSLFLVTNGMPEANMSDEQLIVLRALTTERPGEFLTDLVERGMKQLETSFATVSEPPSEPDSLDIPGRTSADRCRRLREWLAREADLARGDIARS